MLAVLGASSINTLIGVVGRVLRPSAYDKSKTYPPANAITGGLSLITLKINATTEAAKQDKGVKVALDICDKNKEKEETDETEEEQDQADAGAA